jgi:hypothetical protein
MSFGLSLAFLFVFPMMVLAIGFYCDHCFVSYSKVVKNDMMGNFDVNHHVNVTMDMMVHMVNNMLIRQ